MNHDILELLNVTEENSDNEGEFRKNKLSLSTSIMWSLVAGVIAFIMSYVMFSLMFIFAFAFGVDPRIFNLFFWAPALDEFVFSHYLKGKPTLAFVVTAVSWAILVFIIHRFYCMFTKNNHRK